MKDLTELRKIAEAATPGNWIPFEPGEEPGYWWVWLEEKLPWYGGIAQVSESDPGSVCQAMITDSRDPAQDKADATHIATFQPSTVLALIERVEAAEQALDFHTQRDRELKALLSMLSDRLDEFSYDELSSLIEDEPMNQWGESYKSRLEQAEQERKNFSDACKTLAQVLAKHSDWVVEATDSQDIIGEDGDGDWDVVWDRVTELGESKRKAEASVARVRELALESQAEVAQMNMPNIRTLSGEILRALDGDDRV
ncbi:ead/Ea22-like family protein [Glutamicibacter ardleyensis]|uniref:Uncharacterized protein n=1 Tax=Glutamicibacter ardleyensis TaxID=225894 RepID=A0ABQ2DKB3_9MICC|nr:ead/Ea22-like family protein [Glutamicibacter ardleyensis]GGJ59154.1 hypothetical protein GCM10007173_17380 [Glutamicibacter ardleyensis]